MRKSYRQNWVGRLPGTQLLPACLAVADSIEIQDALILPSLCYVYAFVYAVRGSRPSGIV